MKFFQNRNVWIIGASSGIGEALAHELAGRRANLILSARREEELHKICNDLGPRHSVIAFDASDSRAFDAAAAEVMRRWPKIESVIFLSAAYKPSGVAQITMDDLDRIVDVNLKGAFYCVHAVLPQLRKQKSGQLALCGSVAGYRGLPNAQPYAATKAGVISLAESLKIEEEAHGIDVRVINPGFVKTPMTEKNKFPMPMMITAQEAAVAIADQLSGDAFEVHFPKKFTFLMKILRLLPARLYFMVASKLN